MSHAAVNYEAPGALAGQARSPRGRLLVMMFLEFFIWGAWLPMIFGYLDSLGFTSGQQSWILNAFALASFVGMFFSNQFADRNFSGEKFLAFSHLIGGVAILSLTWVHQFWPFFLLMLVHCLFYVPTISITNSIAFANLKDPKKEFGLVRLGGTLGWIAASWPFVFILVDWTLVPRFGSVAFTTWLGTALGTSKGGAALRDATTYTFMAAGIASLVLAAFSLTLPHTPPEPAVKGRETFAWLEAMRLLKVPFILVLFLVTFFDSAVQQCFFIWTNSFLKDVGIPANWVMPVMSIGQIAEIAAMAMLGMVLKRLGWRTTMILGILGHAVRFGLFALAPMPWLAVTVNIVHGICYAFFFAAVYIFVDEFFPKDARTSAQGLFNFLILGFGPFIANFIWPWVGAATLYAVPAERPAPNVAIVSTQYKNLTVKGTAAPGGKVIVTYDDGQQKRMAEATADKEGPNVGHWAEATQFVSHVPSKTYRITASGADDVSPTPVTIVEAVRVNFMKLFLVPTATAIFAALLLLVFFHPPKMAKVQE